MKKLISVLLAFVSVICVTFSFVGCGDGEIKIGTFYSLQEAYDEGFISEYFLQEIAEYHNNDIIYPVSLTEAKKRAIKETAAYDVRSDIRNNHPDCVAEDFIILKYYGQYNGYYAVIIKNMRTWSPAIDVDDWINIGSVAIHYTAHDKIKIWKE